MKDGMKTRAGSQVDELLSALSNRYYQSLPTRKPTIKPTTTKKMCPFSCAFGLKLLPLAEDLNKPLMHSAVARA
jgi:hypothetical protein